MDMFFLGVRFSERGWRRRGCVSVMLLAYVAAAIGYPLPAARSAASHACGQAVCGCGTPEQCKASGCGCAHSPARPTCCSAPEAKPAEQSPCCQKKKGSSCCHVTKSAVKKECCSKPAASKGSAVRFVIGISALKCRGGATEWVSVGAALPLSMPYWWQPSWPCIDAVALPDSMAIGVPISPVYPPPRMAIMAIA